MIKKLKDSYIFMICAREALSMHYTELSDENIDDKKSFIISNYFINEATDYEILYALIEGVIPDKTIDHEDEIRCIKHINNVLLSSKIFKDVDFDGLYPLRDWNISSQSSVAKFVLDNHLLKTSNNNIIKEDISDNKESALSEIIMLSALLYASYKAYKARWNKLYSRCTGLKGEEKKLCIKRAKIGSIKTHINRLRSSYPMCRGTRNPNKCRVSIKSKIQRLENKLKALEETLPKE